MLNALSDHHTEKNTPHVEEMAIYLWDGFDVLFSPRNNKHTPTVPGRLEDPANGKRSRAKPTGLTSMKQSSAVPSILFFFGESGADKGVEYYIKGRLVSRRSDISPRT